MLYVSVGSQQKLSNGMSNEANDSKTRLILELSERIAEQEARIEDLENQLSNQQLSENKKSLNSNSQTHGYTHWRASIVEDSDEEQQVNNKQQQLSSNNSGSLAVNNSQKSITDQNTLFNDTNFKVLHVKDDYSDNISGGSRVSSSNGENLPDNANIREISAVKDRHNKAVVTIAVGKPGQVQRSNANELDTKSLAKGSKSKSSSSRLKSSKLHSMSSAVLPSVVA